MVFHGSMLFFPSYRSVFMVIHGSRLVIHSSRSVFMVFMVPGWSFIVLGWFS